MKIFITGGLGFIGSHLAPKLIGGGHKLLLLSRQPLRSRSNSITFVKGDLNNLESFKNKLKKFKPDAVVHLAWEGLEDYDFRAMTSLRNTVNSLNLVSLAVSLGCKKFLSVGSCWEYGNDEGALKESTLFRPPLHAPDLVIAKRAIKAIGEQVALQGGMQFLWPRLFFAYGPGQKPRTLIASLARAFRNGTRPEIKNRLGGNDFVYIEDAVEAIIKILEKCKRQKVVYNIGSGKITSVTEIANIVARNFGKASIIKEPKKPLGFYADISKIRREIGWRPQTGLEEGVRKTIDYYNKNND